MAVRVVKWPNWCRTGSFCICINSEWEDDAGHEVVGPEVGDVVVVLSRDNAVSNEQAITLAGWGDFYWDISNFRGLTPQEFDDLADRVLVKGAGKLASDGYEIQP